MVYLFYSRAKRKTNRLNKQLCYTIKMHMHYVSLLDIMYCAIESFLFCCFLHKQRTFNLFLKLRGGRKYRFI